MAKYISKQCRYDACNLCQSEACGHYCHPDHSDLPPVRGWGSTLAESFPLEDTREDEDDKSDWRLFVFAVCTAFGGGIVGSAATHLIMYWF